MGLVYAIREDTGKRFVVEIRCDRCDATVSPKSVETGWVKQGWDRGLGSEKIIFYLCPKCVSNVAT